MMLGVVILNYKAWEETIKCVESIYRTTNIEFKIFIVDNNSPNDSFNRLKDTYRDQDEIVCIQAEHNGGFSRGNNIGLRACEKEYIDFVLVTNSDVIFQEGCVDKLYRNAQQNPNAVQIAPKILNSNLKWITYPWSARQSLWQYLNIRSADMLIMKPSELNGLKKVYMVPGGCFIVNRKLFKSIGYFDENVFLYNEEGILSIKAAEVGYDILFDSGAAVIHNHGASTEKGSLFTDAEILKSGMYYWKKYEKISNRGLTMIYSVMVLKMTAKVILGKAELKSYKRYMKECWHAYRKEIRRT